MGDIFNIIIGTSGHIDHGKSSLVKSLTGIDPDRLKEEKEREMTIDLGFAPLLLPDGRKVGIIDVPGHERFIKNMVAGATSIDFVILVIAADDGIMIQTREHLEIMQILGIQKGMVALTKIDVVDKDLVELAKEEIKEFLKGTFLQDAPLVGLSNHTGIGLDEFKQTLFSQLEKITPRETGGIFRMPIQRVFSKHGHGTIITGVPVTGSISIGDEVAVLPGDFRGKVKKIQAYKTNVEMARAGHSAALNIKDIDYKSIERGQIVATPGYFEPSHFFEAKFQYLASMDKPLEHATAIRFHTGTLEEVGQIAILGKKTMSPGEQGYIQIRLESPVVATTGDRFVLRLASPTITIGGGMIISAGEKKLKPLREGIVEQVQQKEQIISSKRARIESILCNVSSYWLRESDLIKISQLPQEELAEAIPDLIATGKILSISGNPIRYIHQTTLIKLQEQIIKSLHDNFAKFPHRIYVKKIDIRNATHLEIGIFDFVIQEMIKLKKIEQRENTIFIPERTVHFSEKQQQILSQIESSFLTQLFQPPEFIELPDMLKQEKIVIQNLFEHLIDKEILVLVSSDPELYFHQQALQEARNKIISYIKEHGELTASDFRNQLNTTRKYIIPLLEYFDRIGLTLRKGNNRILR